MDSLFGCCLVGIIFGGLKIVFIHIHVFSFFDLCMYVKRKKEYEMIERKKEVESHGLNPNDS